MLNFYFSTTCVCWLDNLEQPQVDSFNNKKRDCALYLKKDINTEKKQLGKDRRS